MFLYVCLILTAILYVFAVSAAPGAAPGKYSESLVDWKSPFLVRFDLVTVIIFFHDSTSRALYLKKRGNLFLRSGIKKCIFMCILLDDDWWCSFWFILWSIWIIFWLLSFLKSISYNPPYVSRDLGQPSRPVIWVWIHFLPQSLEFSRLQNCHDNRSLQDFQVTLFTATNIFFWKPEPLYWKFKCGKWKKKR